MLSLILVRHGSFWIVWKKVGDFRKTPYSWFLGKAVVLKAIYCFRYCFLYPSIKLCGNLPIFSFYISKRVKLINCVLIVMLQLLCFVRWVSWNWCVALCNTLLLLVFWCAVIGAFWSSLLFWELEVVPLIGSLCYRLSCFLIVRHPHLRNFNSVISIDVIRIKSNVVGFFNPSCVTRRVMVNIPP